MQSSYFKHFRPLTGEVFMATSLYPGFPARYYSHHLSTFNYYTRPCGSFSTWLTQVATFTSFDFLFRCTMRHTKCKSARYESRNGGANPMINKEDGSIRLNRYERYSPKGGDHAVNHRNTEFPYPLIGAIQNTETHQYTNSRYYNHANIPPPRHNRRINVRNIPSRFPAGIASKCKPIARRPMPSRYPNKDNDSYWD